MEIQLYNTLTHKKGLFSPINHDRAKMFVCGPTAYDYIHIGNARTFIVFDTLARALRVSGLEVEYLQNITDIDDKIITRASEEGVSPDELSKRFSRIFLDDAKLLNIKSVDKYPKATDHIDEVVAQVKKLIEKKNVYLIEGDGWYFDLTTFPNYGKLSGRTVEMAEDGVSRIDASDKKRNKGDFCVWKISKPGEPSWDSDLGAGRPGWHIEDTAITEHYFGPQYDLHGGAEDLIFPHHEAEIAQQESASGLTPFVRTWIHVAFLTVDGKKMSKSLGNFYTMRDVEERGYSPLTFKYLCLGTHYRQKLNFTWEALEGAQNAYQKLIRTLAASPLPEAAPPKEVRPPYPESKSAFDEAISDDLNTPRALAELWEVAHNPELAYEFDKVLGLGLSDSVAKYKNEKSVIPDEVKKILQERELARVGKDWGKADEIRSKLATLGWRVEDSDSGQRVLPL